MPPIKVGVVGYGHGSKDFHLPLLTVNTDYEGSHCTVDFPNIKHYRTADEFFADIEIQFVVVATHTDSHMMFAEKALVAGKHVIVDKPFASSSEEADKVIDIAKSKGLLLTCFQTRRWDGDFMTLRSLINKGALGDIKEAELHYDFEGADKWFEHVTETKYTAGAGMAFGIGPHSVDQALQLFGRPKSVTAFLRAQRGGPETEIEDSFTIILQYDGSQKDLLVTVKTAVITPMAQQLKYLIRGTKGSFLKFQARSSCPQEESIAAGLRPTDDKFGLESEALRGILTTYEEFDAAVQTYDPSVKKYTGRYPSITGRWRGLYENVADAINGKAELAVKAEQSRDGLRVIELARESHDKGITVLWS